MKSLLFLSHRIPYPPDKGDKIRSYHLLKALAGRYRIHLGTFIDSADDHAHGPALRALTCRMECRSLSPRSALIRSAGGLLRGEALSIPYYRDRHLADWVRSTLDEHAIDIVFVFSSAMGQYVETRGQPPTVIDFCDVDSDKWSQYAESKSWPMSSIYRREARRLQEFECRLSAAHELSLFVSDAESRLFASNCQDARSRMMTVRNGVDTGFFDPSSAAPHRVSGGKYAVFTGAMDYWANVDAVTWFVSEVWPGVLDRQPRARFLIVGARPAPEVLRLARSPGVEVLGKVADVRPYLAGAGVVVAPLRIARGVQNKVLEGLAMARPIVATRAALTGLDTTQVPGVRCSDDAVQFCAAVAEALDGRSSRDNPDGRQYVLDNFSWAAALEPLLARMEQLTGPGARV